MAVAFYVSAWIVILCQKKVKNDVFGNLGIILMDKLTTKYIGETSAKLRQVFDAIDHLQGVYLFDEFDAIGVERDDFRSHLWLLRSHLSEFRCISRIFTRT